MIKFFRKIRKNLLTDGKTGKYFKYAIGEILLVVIGILIALSINNWNENKKSERQIKMHLNSLVEAINQDKEYLNQTAILHEFRSNSLIYLFKNSSNTYKNTSRFEPIPKLDENKIWKGAYPDTLNMDFVNLAIVRSGNNDNVVINKNVLDELKNSSLFSAIQNDSLKNAINAYYSYVETSFLLEDWNEQLTFSWREFLRDSYGGLTMELYFPGDAMEFIKSNEPVQIRLLEMIGPSKFRYYKATKAIALAEDVIKEIDKYQSSN